MFPISVWRLLALALPAWNTHCPRCDGLRLFRCAERFRVNASGARLDVWLLYRCPVCELTQKRALERRVAAASLPPDRLAAYQADAPERVRAAAFALDLAVGQELPYRVVRAPLPAERMLHVRVEAPEPIGVRWDRLLARELGWSRARVERALDSGVARLARGDASARVRDGDEIHVDLAGA